MEKAERLDAEKLKGRAQPVLHDFSRIVSFNLFRGASFRLGATSGREPRFPSDFSPSTLQPSAFPFSARLKLKKAERLKAEKLKVSAERVLHDFSRIVSFNLFRGSSFRLGATSSQEPRFPSDFSPSALQPLAFPLSARLKMEKAERLKAERLKVSAQRVLHDFSRIVSFNLCRGSSFRLGATSSQEPRFLSDFSPSALQPSALSFHGP